MKPFNKILIYSSSILIVLIVSTVAAYFNTSAEQYVDFIRPPFSPPSFVFPIVWQILYLLMAVGIANIYVNYKENSNKSLVLYAIQLSMNFIWTFIFFYMQQRLIALLWLVGLIVVVYLMIKDFARHSKLIAMFQIPYLVWLCFATYLNFAIWYLNG